SRSICSTVVSKTSRRCFETVESSCTLRHIPKSREPTVAERPSAPLVEREAGSSATTFVVGEMVAGQYELRSLLGEGGMGQVFEAYDHSLCRKVAIKVAFPSSGLVSLRDEARALAAFRHPSLVTVHVLAEHRGIDFIVMERIYGV